MAKKKSPKKRGKTAEAYSKITLPQNILPVGERVLEDKNIYILQQVYKDIHKFTKNKTTNESGGVLIGTTLEEFGKTNIIINGFVEAKHCEATPTTLTFTHDTWEYIHKEVEKRFPRGKILGWIHTHPDFGIFLSDYDKFIHENFFSEENQIAYVVDPIQNIEGFYFWINGKIEKCNGFYIYDKNGSKIDVEIEKEDDVAPEYEIRKSGVSFRDVLLAVLTVIVAFLLVITISQNKTISKLEEEHTTLINGMNSLQQQILNYHIDSYLSSEETQDSTQASEQTEEDNSDTTSDDADIQ